MPGVPDAGGDVLNLGVHHHRHVDGGGSRLVVALEATGGDADDRQRAAVEQHRAPDDVGDRRGARAPVVVAEHGPGRSAEPVVGRVEQAAERRANAEDLDFDSVQRGNAEIQRRAQEVIDRCWALGPRNPILSIHDVGAGGLSNALPEIVHGSGRGGRIDLRAAPNEEPGMTPREVWCNEAQERYVLAIAPESLELFRQICERERCPFAVVGEATEARHLEVRDPLGTVLVDDVSFTVRGGEVLVVAGVQGNGQTELTEALMGLQRDVHGSVRLDGQELVGRTVRQILDAGVGFIPEDRSTDGLVGEFTVAENLMLDRTSGPPFVRRGVLQLAELARFATEAVDEFDIRTQGITEPVGRLSGGNQQKVVVARELSKDLRLLVAAQPTRGVDVGSIEFIHKRIVATRDAGVPVVVVSTELDEAAALGDRILVMYRGRVVGIVPADTPRDVLGLMMAGIPAKGTEAA